MSALPKSANQQTKGADSRKKVSITMDSERSGESSEIRKASSLRSFISEERQVIYLAGQSESIAWILAQLENPYEKEPAALERREARQQADLAKWLQRNEGRYDTRPSPMLLSEVVRADTFSSQEVLDKLGIESGGTELLLIIQSNFSKSEKDWRELTEWVDQALKVG